jgi:Tfp pilus assembly major pilin PilA
MHGHKLVSNRKSVSEHSQTHFEFKRNRINSVEAEDTKFFSKLKELFKKISSPRENVTTHEFDISPEEYLTDDEKITIETNEPYSGSTSPRLEEETKNLLETSSHIPEINITNLEKEIKGKKTSDKLKCISEELGIRRCASQEAFGEITPRMEKEETCKETENRLNGDRTYNVDEFSFQETETVYSKTNEEGTSSSLLHSSDGSTSWDNSFAEDHPVILQYLHSKLM